MGLAKLRQRIQIRQRILRSQGRVYLINFLFDFVCCQLIMARPDSIPPPPAIIGADMADFQPWNFKSVVFKPLGILKNLGKGAVGYQFVAQSPDLVVKIKLLQTGMMIFASRTPCRASIAACFTSFFHCFNQTFLCVGAGGAAIPSPAVIPSERQLPVVSASGKRIKSIRKITGRGTLRWGSRRKRRGLPPEAPAPSWNRQER